MFGAVSLPAGETLSIVLYKLGILREHPWWSAGDEAIVWSIRLPRVLGVALIGSALGLAGLLFQAVLRNPLADPYVIGTSAGAQLGVTAAIISPISFSLLGFGSIQVAAFAGALLTVATVYLLARTGGRTPVVTLLLAGFVLSSFLISATSFLAAASHRLDQILSWTLGGVAVTGWEQLGVAAPTILVCAVLAGILSRYLDTLLLGEEGAMHLGVPVERLKVGAVVLAALLTATAVTLSGIVAFVGLVVPHAARLIFGAGHRVLVPATALGGATFLVLADLAARMVLAPTEIPLGIMAAILGAPFFLHLLRQSRRAYGI